MPATVSQVATAIATKLATVSGLRTVAFQPDQLNPPVAFPILNGITYHNAFQGGDVEMDWNIMVVVGRYTARTSYSVLDGYLSYSGASSIRAALEGDPTLGGVVQTCVLPSSASIASVTQGEEEFLSVEFTLTVHA